MDRQRNSCSGPSKSVTSDSFDCGSPTSSDISNQWRSPRRTRGRLHRGHRLRRLGHRRFLPCLRSGHRPQPDPSSFQILPWTTSNGRHHSARMFCDVAMPDGTPAGPTRATCCAAGSTVPPTSVSAATYTPRSSSSSSGTHRSTAPPTPADSGGYFDRAVHDAAPHFRRHAIEALRSMGISVEFSHHEGAPVSRRSTCATPTPLSMADNVMTFRYVIKGSPSPKAAPPPSYPNRSASTRARPCTP